MKSKFFFFISLFISTNSFCQRTDSIYFHLYTDSLKKGTHNYINVDGKSSNGKWFPMTSKEIDFSSDFGKWERNDLILPTDFKEEKVKIKATLKSNPSVCKEITMWIKKIPDPDRLPTKDEILYPQRKKRKGNN